MVIKIAISFTCKSWVFIFPANLLSILSMLFFNAFCQKNINFPSHAHQWAKRIKLLIFLNCTKCILRTTAKLYQVRKKSNNTQRVALDGGTMIFFPVLCRNTGLLALRKKKTAPTVTVKNVWKDPIFSDIRNMSVFIAPNSAPCAVILWLLLFLRSVSSPF